MQPLETQTLEHQNGFTLSAAIYADDATGAPWEEHDGHGPVSDWTTRDVVPGELVLCQDHGSSRYYNFAKAVRIAKRDKWNAPPYDAPGRAGRAVMADFERLRGWCRGDWQWIGIIVTASRAGVELGSASLWGIESDAGDYLQQVIAELVPEAIEAAQAKLMELCHA